MSLLTLRGLTKKFGGLVAVSDVSLDIEEGSIVGLIGPNGAGKTTLFNLITGNYRPDAGEIHFNKASIAGLSTHRIVSLGIARTFQTIRLFQNLSVLENCLAGRHCRMTSGFLKAMVRTPAQQREEKAALIRALGELSFVGLQQQAETLARNLSYGNQRLLELARALATDPRLLILDEPAGGMNNMETAQLVHLIRAIRNQGVTILLIEHDMTLVMEVCERVVVLENGCIIAAGRPADIKADPKVIEAYLGMGED